MLFTFFQSPFWRGVVWIGGFLALYAALGFQISVITALVVIAMRQTKGKDLLF